MIEAPRYKEAMRLLVKAQVKMVIIGGVAMIVRAAGTTTIDVDICYEQSRANIERLCQALAPRCSMIRSAFLDIVEVLLANQSSQGFQTDFGQIDLLSKVSGLGEYAEVMRFATQEAVDDFAAYVLTLEGLIKAKESANRLKDQQHLVTLRALKEMEDEENNADN